MYSVLENGVEDLWSQSVDGSSGQKAAHFDSDRIYWIRRSPDAKKILIGRLHFESDVVLIRSGEQ
jgi:hypothetical protein